MTSVAGLILRRLSVRNRAGSVLLVCVLLGGVLVATIGAGYVVSKPILDNPGAYVAKPDTVAYANSESGKVEAETPPLGTGKDPLDIVEQHDGRISVTDRRTGDVRTYDPRTMTPVGPPADVSDPPQPGAATGDGGVAVVAGPDSGYVGTGNTVAPIDRDGRQGPLATLPGRIVGQIVPDAAEGIWVLIEDGRVVHVVHGEVRRVVSADTSVRHLTLAEGHPIGLTEAGDLLDLSAKSPRRISRDPVPSGDGVLVGSARGAGRWILVLDRPNGRLSAVDVRTGTPRTVGGIPHGHDLGAPVQLEDRVYIPDYVEHALHVRDLGSGASIPSIKVPGRTRDFSLEVHGGTVWANDRFDRRPVTIDRNGSTKRPDKGPGPNQTDTDPPPDAKLDNQPPRDPKPDRTPPPAPPPAPPKRTQTPESPAPPAPVVPPVAVPRVDPGTPVDQACQRITAARLTCAPVAAGAGGPTGAVVSDQPTDPPAETLVPRSSRVVVRHYGPTRVPDVARQYSGNACQVLVDARLKCALRPLPDPAPRPEELDVVQRQDPPAAAEAATGSDVAIMFYDKAVLSDYSNQPGAAACTALRQSYRGVTCTVVEGGSQAATGRPAGVVYAQTPGLDTVIQSGAAVTLTVATGSPQVPDVTGRSPEEAQAILQQTGYAANLVPDRIDRTRIVGAQEPAPGTPMDPGGTVTVHYTPNEPVQLALWQFNTGDPVYLLAPADTPPHRDYTTRREILGLGYPAGSSGPGLAPLYDHYCTGSTTICLGYSRNHYFSRGSAVFHDNWQPPQGAPSVLTDCGAGRVPIWRVWKIDSPGGERRHRYSVRTDDGAAAGYPGNELLGCLWSS